MITLNLNLEPKPVPAYLEIIGEFSERSEELSGCDLEAIGEFTRENIQSWLKRRSRSISGPDPLEGDLLGDFHAVYRGIEIPWAMEDSKSIFETGHDTQGHRHDTLASLRACREKRGLNPDRDGDPDMLHLLPPE